VMSKTVYKLSQLQGRSQRGQGWVFPAGIY